jgi:hypothetical protein
MKRYWFLVILVMVLSACSVEVVQPVTPQVTITPATTDVAPSGAIEFTATVNDTRTTNFEWELVNASTSFQPLESNSSRIRLTAPAIDGEYTLRAKTTAFDSTVGEAKIRVDQLLAAQILNAVSLPNGSTAGPGLITGNLLSNASVNYAVTVSADVVSKGTALFLEVIQPSSGTGITLTTYSPDRKVYASSSTPDFFTAGSLPATALLSPTGLPTVTYQCGGPCVVQDAQAVTFYVKLTNTSSANANYSFYAYTKNYEDTGENANDQTPGINLTTSEKGAIESLSDVDIYNVQKSGSLTFTNTSKVDVVAVVLNSQGAVQQTLTNGQIAPVQIGQRIEVKSQSGTKAAPAGSSTYGLAIN